MKFLRSPKLSLGLFLLLASLMLLGLLVPQKALLAPAGLYGPWKAENPVLVGFLEAFGFTDLYTSPLVIGAWILFFLNLVFVMTDRAGAAWRKTRLPEAEKLPLPSAMRCWGVLPAEEDGALRWAERLSDSGYRTVCALDAVYAVKYRLSPLATLVFHLSFFLMLTGALVSTWTRFSGTTLLAEGESYEGAMGPYMAQPRIQRFGRPPKARFTLLSVAPTAEGMTAVDITAQVADEAGQVSEVRVNRPYKRDHASFVLLDIGVAPLLVLRDPSGREVDGAFVKLILGRHSPEPFGLGGIPMEASFFSDYAEEVGVSFSRSKEFQNPVLKIRIRNPRTGEVSGEGKLKPGESLAGSWGSVSFQEYRFAAKFFVRRERGVWLVYAGFALACAALACRLFFYRREFALRLVGEGDTRQIEVGGRSEYYQSLFEEEFEGLIRKFRPGFSLPLAAKEGSDGRGDSQ